MDHDGMDQRGDDEAEERERQAEWGEPAAIPPVHCGVMSHGRGRPARAIAWNGRAGIKLQLYEDGRSADSVHRWTSHGGSGPADKTDGATRNRLAARGPARTEGPP